MRKRHGVVTLGRTGSHRGAVSRQGRGLSVARCRRVGCGLSGTIAAAALDEDSGVGAAGDGRPVTAGGDRRDILGRRMAGYGEPNEQANEHAWSTGLSV